jgi:hypothetical protein
MWCHGEPNGHFNPLHEIAGVASLFCSLSPVASDICLVTGVIWDRRFTSCENSEIDVWGQGVRFGFGITLCVHRACDSWPNIWAVRGVRVIRFERSASEKHVPIAIATFSIQYGLAFVSSYAHGYVLVPTLFLYTIVLALAVAIWLGTRARSKAGTRARSKAGTRIALAGAFTLAAYLCKFGYDIHQLPHLHL